MGKRFVYMDGKMVPWEKANVHIATHSLHYGSAVFEGVRAYKSRDGVYLFRPKEHAQRLRESARIVGIDFSMPVDGIVDAMAETVRKKCVCDTYVRPIVYLGSDSMGLDSSRVPVHFAVIAVDLDAYLGEKAEKEGIKCKISKYVKIGSRSIPQIAKASANYLVSDMATREAKKAGFDEAILLNSKGRVAEGPGENMFIVKNGKLITPSLDEDILAGVTRKSILEIAKHRKIPAVERHVKKSELLSADEALFTGTAAEVVPIVGINGRRIGSGKPGKITKIIQEEFDRIIRRKHAIFNKWLYKV